MRLVVATNNDFFLSECPYPFENYENNCFYLSQDQVQWREAEIRCYGLGGELVSIYNRDKQIDMMNYLDDEFHCSSSGIFCFTFLEIFLFSSIPEKMIRKKGGDFLQC